MGIQYQNADQQDIDIIFQLNQQLIQKYENIEAIDYDRVLKWVYQKIKQQISQYQSIWLAGEKVGYFFLHDEGDQLELDDLYIFDCYQRQGIGSHVLKECLQVAKQRQRNLFLYVFST